MKRRYFLKNTAFVASAPLLMNGINLSLISKPDFFASPEEDSDRVLVLIQLNGGNDGLNTIIPLDQYQNLYKARPKIIIPENKIIRATDKIGFHPAMMGLKTLFTEGKLKIVQSVGYPDMNRSHFRSMEIWNTGSPSSEVWSTGWLGRHLDDQYPNFPDNYPNQQYVDPFAISMDYFTSDTCQGKAANFSVALGNTLNIKEVSQKEDTEGYGPHFKEELEFVKLMGFQTNNYADQVKGAADRGKNLANYPDTELAAQLKNVAKLISGGLKTKVYVVTLGGFDTHAEQVVAGDPLAGRHAELLRPLSEAITAFQDDLKKQNLEKRVIGMTYSEFGRQILANASYGTDHGAAAPLFLFGSCVNPIILGTNPVIPSQVDVQAAVPMQYDFRNIYGSILKDWFGIPEQKIRTLLYANFQPLPIVNCAISTTPTKERKVDVASTDFYNYPNPFSDNTTIFYSSASERVRLSVFDATGKVLEVLQDKLVMEGNHEVQFAGQNLPAGLYYLRLETSEQQKTVKMIKN